MVDSYETLIEGEISEANKPTLAPEEIVKTSTNNLKGSV